MSYALTVSTDDEYGDDSVARMIFTNTTTGHSWSAEVSEASSEYSALIDALDALHELAQRKAVS